MSYHPLHERRALMGRLEPALRATANRWLPQLEEWTADLGAGREIVMPPLRPCQWCYGQRKILEPGPLGFMAVLCGRCGGDGWDPPR